MTVADGVGGCEGPSFLIADQLALAMNSFVSEFTLKKLRTKVNQNEKIPIESVPTFDFYKAVEFV